MEVAKAMDQLFYNWIDVKKLWIQVASRRSITEEYSEWSKWRQNGDNESHLASSIMVLQNVILWISSAYNMS